MNTACEEPLAARSRDFGFTWNNYSEEHIDYLSGIDCTYLVYGKEVAPSTGTPHLQGYIRFGSAITKSSCIKKLKGAHVYIKRGSFDEIIDYSKSEGKHADKEGSLHEVFEKGTRPMNQPTKGDCNKRRYEEAYNAAKDGRFDDIPADLMTRHYATYKKVRFDNLPKPATRDVLLNEWRWGATGTGKTRGVLQEYPDAYHKSPAHSWWDGYDGEETVLVDDFDKFHVARGYEVKLWGDHGPFPAESKGSIRSIRPFRIIITSNYHPKDIWQDEPTLFPILRRFKVVEYKSLGDAPCTPLPRPTAKSPPPPAPPSDSPDSPPAICPSYNIPPYVPRPNAP